MRAAQEREFTTHDGTTLFYRYWPAAASAGEPRAIVLFHRGHEHSGRLQHVVDELALEDYAMFAWDARGHGRSPGARGDSPSFAASVKDVDSFIRHIAREHAVAPERIAVIAQSMAAVLVATWAHDYAPSVRCLVLTTPAFKVKLYVPLARAGLGFLQRVRGNFFITSYVKAKFLTHDPERMRSYDEDPLVTRAISVRVLLGLFDAGERIVADAQAIRLPVQLLVSDTDWVVHRGPQERFFERLGSSVKERHVLPGFLHDTLGERDRRIAIDKVRDFIERAFRDPPLQPPQWNAPGYTHAEEAALRRPLPALALRNIYYALTRFSMQTLGRLSSGIRLGLASGFDSGSSLDYVYRNEAGGTAIVGKWIDRGYLNAIGWRGVRVRREHLARAIAAAAQQLRDRGVPLHVLDIAAGPGRYLLEAIATLDTVPQSIVLRDYDQANVDACAALIRAQGLAAIARSERADAFDDAAIGALRPQPTLVVASGLYELYSDNSLVARSLGGIARAIVPGGCFIYTGQPWHPQLELIARTLTTHRGHQPWVMRRRTQAELDALVAAAAFAKVTQWIDEWGMFTVSLARRI
jgi:alpha-beta hydrolase superfamily lysophospholipase